MALAFKKYSSEKLQTEVIFNLSRVIYYCLENTASKRSVVLANVTVTVTAIVNSIFHWIALALCTNFHLLRDMLVTFGSFVFHCSLFLNYCKKNLTV